MAFGDILDMPSKDIEPPKNAPQGTYVTVVQGLPRYDKSSRKGTEFVEFTLGFLQAADDVDEDEIKAWLTSADGSVAPLQEKTIRVTYYLTENSIYRLKQFCDDCGVDEDDHSLRQRVELAAGCQVLAHVKHQPSEDGTRMFANVDRTAPVA